MRLVQVREQALDAGARDRFAREVLARTRARGGLVVVNGDIELAQAIGADGVHLPARRLMALSERPAFQWVGASCHDRAELEHAAALTLDYALLGPVLATDSHPGAASLGWSGFSALTEGLPMPVLALGGLSPAVMETARDAGAHGIAGIRGIWG